MDYLQKLVIMHVGGSSVFEVGKLANGSKVVSIERSGRTENSYHITHENGMRMEIISPTAFLWYAKKKES